MDQTNEHKYGVDIPLINRFAVLLEPTREYLKWARGCPEHKEEATLDDVRHEMTVYLVPPLQEGLYEWLDKR